VIALASGEASVLVSGDNQMLGFRVPGLAILSPRAFLEALED
jgi:predicted nucleic acid-binding protein